MTNPDDQRIKAGGGGVERRWLFTSRNRSTINPKEISPRNVHKSSSVSMSLRMIPKSQKKNIFLAAPLATTVSSSSPGCQETVLRQPKTSRSPPVSSNQYPSAPGRLLTNAAHARSSARILQHAAARYCALECTQRGRGKAESSEHGHSTPVFLRR